MRSYLNENVAVTVKKTKVKGRRNPLRRPNDTNSPAKVEMNFANKRPSSVGIVRLRTKSHGVCF
jgi:hypothetical protein